MNYSQIPLPSTTLFHLENNVSKKGILVVGQSNDEVKDLCLGLHETHNVYCLINPNPKQVIEALDYMEDKIPILGAVVTGRYGECVINALIHIKFKTAPVVLIPVAIIRDHLLIPNNDYKGKVVQLGNHEIKQNDIESIVQSLEGN